MSAAKNPNKSRRGATVSCRKGGARKRKTAHQNKFAFKHNKNSVKTARLIKLPNKTLNCCPSCVKQIQWRVNYRKYKPLKQPKRCNNCDGKGSKGVLSAYHTVCAKCAKKKNMCAKCTMQKDDWLVGSDVEEGDDENMDDVKTGRKSLKSCRRRGILSAANNTCVESRSVSSNSGNNRTAVDPFAIANRKIEASKVSQVDSMEM